MESARKLEQSPTQKERRGQFGSGSQLVAARPESSGVQAVSI